MVAQHRGEGADVAGDRVEFGAAQQARDAALQRGGHPEPLDAGPCLQRARLAAGWSRAQVAEREARLPQPDPGGEGLASAHFIAEHGRWAKTSPRVLEYIRPVEKWRGNPMRGIGL